MTRLIVIDGIGPFFRGDPRHRVNWSKVAFSRLERDGDVDRARFDGIREDFSRLCDAAATTGFNAVTLDDVAHLADWQGYAAGTRRRIAAYREEFARLFAIAADRRLDVYLTVDVMFYNAAIRRRIGSSPARAARFLAERLDELFRTLPQVRGIVFRIGESDSADVEDEFRSRLIVKTPRDLRRFLAALFPVFERLGRDLILRTWTVGAYPIGDLMWNRHTFLRTFEGLDHPRLILSMKYGESDFFRFLPLSKQFHRTSHRKIIELQARREYEGSGEYPSFVGWEYETYLRQLADRPDIVGLSVWCQTGGWSTFRRLTFVERSSPWVELNAFATVRMFRDGWSADRALEAFRQAHFPAAAPEAWRRFLRLSDEVIRELLYVNEYALRKVYFRRVRIPPLITVYWDNIFINPYVRQFLRCFVADGEARIREGYAALEKLDEMLRIAEAEGLPAADVAFQRDTFEILAAAREFYFRPRNRPSSLRILALVRQYRVRHPTRYTVHLGLLPAAFSRRRLRWAIGLLLRHRRGYRPLDRLLVLRFLGIAFPLILRATPGRVSEFAREQGMGWRTLLR